MLIETALEWKFPESIQRRSCGRCRREKMVLEVRGSHAATPGVSCKASSVASAEKDRMEKGGGGKSP